MANGLHKKGYTKCYDKVLERIGRLKQKYAKEAQYYTIPDPSSKLAISIDWKHQENTHETHLGVYCLRTNETQRFEARLWKTEPEPEQIEVYHALGVNSLPRGIQKTVVKRA